MEPQGSLRGKVVVVTGAAGRFGRRVVHHFAREGARIAAVVRSEEEARRIPFPDDAEGWGFPADVSREELVGAAFDRITDRLGPVDHLIHAVGAWEMRPLLETSLDDWEGMMRVNLTTAFLCFREAARRMQGRGGSLVGIASMQGADRGVAQQAAYAAAKAGLIRLVEATAAEFAGTGLTAHALAPSTILYEDAAPPGVPVDDLVRLCHILCTPAREALNGSVLRAYGS